MLNGDLSSERLLPSLGKAAELCVCVLPLPLLPPPSTAAPPLMCVSVSLSLSMSLYVSVFVSVCLCERESVCVVMFVAVYMWCVRMSRNAGVGVVLRKQEPRFLISHVCVPLHAHHNTNGKHRATQCEFQE